MNQTIEKPRPYEPLEKIVRMNAGDGLDDDLILAVDESGAELLRLEFRVMDRNTRETRYVRIQFPAEQEFEAFRTAVSEWILSIAAFAPGAVVPEDWEELQTQVDLYKLWVKMTTPLFYHRPIRQSGMDIVFKYLKPYVLDGDSLEGTGTLIEKSALWLRGHVAIHTSMRMLQVILLVDDFVKKNAIYLLTTIYHLAIQSPSTVESQKSKTPQSLTSSPRALLRSGFMFDA